MSLLLRRLAPAVALLSLAASASPAHAALSAVGPVDPATTAPAFYTDANGLQHALCKTGTPNCGPLVPGEDFYNLVTSTFTMANGGTAALTLDMTLAPNASGNPAVFNRVRIQIDGAPAGTYTITHPYGTDTVSVASAGARGRTTTDIGCLVATVGVCNFADAMAGRYGPFLTAGPLAAGATCSVGVTFKPGASGARSAALTFADNTAAATHTIALSGNGTNPAAPAAPAPAPAPQSAPAPAPVPHVDPPVVAPKLKLD